MRSACRSAFIPHRVQLGDRPQAELLLAGLRGVGHVIADAAYDADSLRVFVDDLGATPQTKTNPSRAIAPSIRLAALQGPDRRGSAISP